MLKDIASPSASDAIISGPFEPISVWFSAASKVADEEIIGELSFRLFIFIVMLWFVVNDPSAAVIVSV